MMRLSPGQAHYVLTTLMSQGRLRAGQVQKVLKSREDEIRSLRDRLASLESLAAGKKATARARRGRPRRAAARKAKARRRRPMSPRVRALRRQQGRYMGYVRRLKPAEKARVKSVREKQGMGAAIKLAASLGSKKS